jgi:hypothetical protein
MTTKLNPQPEENPGAEAKPAIEPVRIDLNPEPTPSLPTDPFDDLSKLRLDQSFVETAGVKKLLTTVPVGKPRPQDFIRVHPDPEYRDQFALIELKTDREQYLVLSYIARELPGECYMATIYTVINRQGTVQLWPVRLPAPDGRIVEWHRSAADAAERAIKSWIRVKADMDLGAYVPYEAAGSIPDPEWPAVSFRELLRIAFRDRLVDRLDHPVIKRLRGAQCSRRCH